MNKITIYEFEKQYCENSDLTIDEYNELLITLPCNCGHRDCQGFAAVCRDERSIKSHLDLYV